MNMAKIIFMGTPDFSVPILRQLIEDQHEILAVVTQPDRPVGRKKILTAPPVKVEAEKHGIRILQPEKIRDPKEVKVIVDLEPELIVTAAYGQILPNSILEAPKFGCINVHASLLPELRGGAPIHYAIMQGKEKTGITIMYMVQKLDAGDIISQVEVPIDEEDNVGTLHNKLSEAGAQLLSSTIPRLLAGEVTPIPQDDSLATFAYNITREQELIHWDRKGEVIYNHIRGLAPWPVAYTKWRDSTLKIWKAEKSVLDQVHDSGTVVAMDKDSFTVASSNLVGIKILELQPAGKRKMSTEQFLLGAGATLKIGERLGNHDD